MEQSEKPEQQKIDEQAQKQLKFNFLKFLSSFFAYIKLIINIKDDVDKEGTTEGILKDIEFKGFNAWILICSIIIASIGLNVNSTALVIGAMLISPLMGPIVGFGFSLATNNWQTLLKSLKSLGTAVALSVITSALYFLITPFGEVQSELIARTSPTLLDVMVAIFGGVAGIVAGSRKIKTNVIPGVAIATALMPPLCTAGYGLANANWDFFFGAFYLFLINGVFIALSTLVVVKYLNFPVKEFIDKKREKNIKRYILICSILIIIPSGFTFWEAIKESIFKNNAENYITENFELSGSKVINKKYTYSSDSTSTIEVFMIGEIIDNKKENELKRRLANYEGLENTKLRIHQSKDNSTELAGKISAQVRTGIIEDIYRKKEELLKDKDKKITFLEDELIKIKKDTIPFSSLKSELKAQYPKIQKVSAGKLITTSFSGKQDTLINVLLQWDNEKNEEEKQANTMQIQKWLRVKLNDPKLQVINYDETQE